MFNINSVINRTLIYFPIFKILINNLKFVEENNINTACTNGSTVYYNSNFFQTLTKDEQVFVLAHEIMHITLKHISRLEDRNIEIWNYATDAVTNQILKKNGLPIVPGTINCPDALDYSAEEYYEIIKNRPDCEELMSKYRHEKDNSNIASHESWDKEEAEDISKSLPDITEHNITKINKDIIKNENNEFLGNVNDQTKETINLDSVGESSSIIDWKQFLKKEKKKVIATDYNLYSGYFDEEGIYKYPYQFIYKGDVEILIDTSASVDEELVKAFLRECKNIFNNFEIKIGCFDTRFYGFHKIVRKEQIDNFVIEGRGGTDFNVAANSFDKKAKVKIIFTDGYSTMPTNSNDIIWIVYGNTTIKPLGGKVFYVDPNTLTYKGRSK